MRVRVRASPLLPSSSSNRARCLLVRQRLLAAARLGTRRVLLLLGLRPAPDRARVHLYPHTTLKNGLSLFQSVSLGLLSTVHTLDGIPNFWTLSGI